MYPVTSPPSSRGELDVRLISLFACLYSIETTYHLVLEGAIRGNTNFESQQIQSTTLVRVLYNKLFTKLANSSRSWGILALSRFCTGQNRAKILQCSPRARLVRSKYSAFICLHLVTCRFHRQAIKG